MSTEECNNNFSRTIIEKILATKKNEEAKYEKNIEMGISFLRSTFVSLRRNRKKKKKEEKTRGRWENFPPVTTVRYNT